MWFGEDHPVPDGWTTVFTTPGFTHPDEDDDA